MNSTLAYEWLAPKLSTDERKSLDVIAKDAERYRWLREQHWSSAELCVVMAPKDAVKLGHTCPSCEYLDAAIDAAMARTPAVGAA